jgi:hypothetical protein
MVCCRAALIDIFGDRAQTDVEDLDHPLSCECNERADMASWPKAQPVALIGVCAIAAALISLAARTNKKNRRPLRALS